MQHLLHVQQPHHLFRQRVTEEAETLGLDAEVHDGRLAPQHRLVALHEAVPFVGVQQLPKGGKSV